MSAEGGVNGVAGAMKSSSDGWSRKCARLVGALVLFGAVAAGCAHKVPLQPSLTQASAAEGEVTVIDKRYGIRVVKLEIADLQQPATFSPAAQAYVVWARKPGAETQNVGALRLKNNAGVLEAVAPYDRFQLFVTAESSENVQSPSNRPLFAANVDL